MAVADGSNMVAIRRNTSAIACRSCGNGRKISACGADCAETVAQKTRVGACGIRAARNCKLFQFLKLRSDQPSPGTNRSGTAVQVTVIGGLKWRPVCREAKPRSTRERTGDWPSQRLSATTGIPGPQSLSHRLPGAAFAVSPLHPFTRAPSRAGPPSGSARPAASHAITSLSAGPSAIPTPAETGTTPLTTENARTTNIARNCRIRSAYTTAERRQSPTGSDFREERRIRTGLSVRAAYCTVIAASASVARLSPFQ